MVQYIGRIKDITRETDNVDVNCNIAVIMLKHNNSLGKEIIEDYVSRKLCPVKTFHFYLNYLIENQNFRIAIGLIKVFLSYHPEDTITKLALFNLYLYDNILDSLVELGDDIINHGVDREIEDFIRGKIDDLREVKIV